MAKQNIWEENTQQHPRIEKSFYLTRENGQTNYLGREYTIASSNRKKICINTNSKENLQLENLFVGL